jgi:hypothetical protein
VTIKDRRITEKDFLITEKDARVTESYAAITGKDFGFAEKQTQRYLIDDARPMLRKIRDKE